MPLAQRLDIVDDVAHSDSRPYICSLCGKRSNWKWDVKKHILSVHRGTMGSILDEQLNKVCYQVAEVPGVMGFPPPLSSLFAL